MYTEQTEWGLKRSLSSSTKWKKISWSNKSKTETSMVTYLGGKKKTGTFWRDQHRQSYPAAVH